MRTALLTGLVVVAVGVAGCSGNRGKLGESPVRASPSASDQSPTPAAVSSSPDMQELGRAYLRFVGPANAALALMARGFASLPATATGADVARIAGPAGDAIDRADEQLLRVPWPAPVSVDVKAMVVANAAVANDLRSVDGQDALSISGWETQLAADSGKMAGTVAVVRADLGLPSASSASCGNAHCY